MVTLANEVLETVCELFVRVVQALSGEGWLCACCAVHACINLYKQIILDTPLTRNKPHTDIDLHRSSASPREVSCTDKIRNIDSLNTHLIHVVLTVRFYLVSGQILSTNHANLY